MLEYKILKCDVSKLIPTNKSKEDYIRSSFINSVFSWVIDIDDEYVTIEEEIENKIKQKKIKITEWDYYKKIAPVLEREWYEKTLPGFEERLNELGREGFKLVSDKENAFVFMKQY